MDYKKLIPSRNIRIKILELLNFIPDKQMIQLQYYIKTGRRLNLKNPKRYTEKLQWYKLYYRNEIMRQCVDKYEVRKYIENNGLGNILNECYGIYNSYNEIDFDKLPDKFVIKDTLGGGGNSVILVENNKNIDNNFRNKIDNWTLKDITKKNSGREWVYDGRKHRIIIEKYIKPNSNKSGLIDYKFFCFNGKVHYVYGISERKIGIKAKLGIYDRNFHFLPVRRIDELPADKPLEKSLHYEDMIRIAEKLSKPFPHVRVDLYNVQGKIIFGEMTFFDGSGYMKFEPDSFDFELGKHFII